MGLLPIIYTALSIFTIGLTVILSISYLLYKMKPRQSKPYKGITIEPYNLFTPVEQPVYNTIPIHSTYNNLYKTERRNNTYSDNKRFEVLNTHYNAFSSRNFNSYANQNRNVYYGYENNSMINNSRIQRYN